MGTLLVVLLSFSSLGTSSGRGKDAFSGTDVLPAPLDHVLDSPVVLPLVLGKETRSLGVGRRVGVGVAQQRLDRRQNRCDTKQTRTRRVSTTRVRCVRCVVCAGAEV